MKESILKKYRYWIIALVIVCMAVIMGSAVYYIHTLKKNLEDQAVASVMTVTAHQQQAFDNFISNDRELLHSNAEYMTQYASDDEDTILGWMSSFSDMSCVYSIVMPAEGVFYSSRFTHNALSDEQAELYRALPEGSMVRDPFPGAVSGRPMFGCCESFRFSDGVLGLMQKSYYCDNISEDFSLSFYDGQGMAYVIDSKGEILLRSNGMMGDHLYENVFEIITGNSGNQEDIDRFVEARQAQEAGSMVFSGRMGTFVYTYVPLENVSDWYLISIVNMNAITDEADNILSSSRVLFTVLALMLAICAVFVLLMWRTHRDIREKDREIELQEQLFNILSAYLSNNTDDVYMLVDIETHSVDYVSPNVERVMGVSRESVENRLENFGRAEYESGITVEYETVDSMELGESIDAVKTKRFNAKIGEHKWFQETVYCTTVQGRKKAAVYIFDRTQDRQAQEALSEALRMAQVANMAKSAFLSSISHDIRTPMNAIMGLVTLMKDEADNPAIVRDYAQRIDAASQHLLGLINDVLDMNKIESGSTTLNVTELSLSDIIEEINTIIRPQTKAKNQSFEIFVSSKINENLLGDKLRINQILINILSNAVKYTQEGGSIALRVEEVEQLGGVYCRLRFIVSDNGQGMSEEYQKIMFDPFTREDTEAVRQIQGTGLGMAITKRLVDLMGGTIEVESRLGEGSTFTVELEMLVQEQEDEPDFWGEYGLSRMIVVDDDEEDCLNVVRAMEDAGVGADYVTDGRKAIELMRDARESGKPYDLILLDWKMPNLDGLELARLIRKNYSDKIPIFLFTAYDWDEIESEACKIGVDRFVSKPFFMSVFKETIRKAMGGRRAAQEQEDLVVKDKHILVVDDIEVNRIILMKILTSLGAGCDAAENGEQAVNMFTQSGQGEYDIILMDVQMPVMDGYEATRAIRASGHPDAGAVPIIAMTANAFVDDVRNAINAGMDAHVSKPVQVDNLKATIQRVLDSKKRKNSGEKNV